MALISTVKVWKDNRQKLNSPTLGPFKMLFVIDWIHFLVFRNNKAFLFEQIMFGICEQPASVFFSSQIHFLFFGPSINDVTSFPDFLTPIFPM